jgi:hypothetical protein
MLALVGAVTAAAACSSTAATTDTCRAVESARCRYTACFASDGAFASTPSESACIAAATDACRGGTVAAIAPSTEAQSACIAAIDAAGQAGNCQGVRAPATLASCSFLVVAAADAGRD